MYFLKHVPRVRRLSEKANILLHNFLTTTKKLSIPYDKNCNLQQKNVFVSRHTLTNRCHHQCQSFWGWWCALKCVFLPRQISIFHGELRRTVIRGACAHGAPRGSTIPMEKSFILRASRARIQIRQLLLVIKPVFAHARLVCQIRWNVINGLLYVNNKEKEEVWSKCHSRNCCVFSLIWKFDF